MSTVIGSIIVFGLLGFLVFRQVMSLKKDSSCNCSSCSKACKTKLA